MRSLERNVLRRHEEHLAVSGERVKENKQYKDTRADSGDLIRRGTARLSTPYLA